MSSSAVHRSPAVEATLTGTSWPGINTMCGLSANAILSRRVGRPAGGALTPARPARTRGRRGQSGGDQPMGSWGSGTKPAHLPLPSAKAAPPACRGLRTAARLETCSCNFLLMLSRPVFAGKYLAVFSLLVNLWVAHPGSREDPRPLSR